MIDDDDTTPPYGTPIHYDLTPIPAQVRPGLTAPEPISHVPIEPISDYWVVINHAQHLHDIGRSGDSSYIPVFDEVRRHRHWYLHLYNTLPADDKLWWVARDRLTTLRRLLREIP